MLDNFSTFYRQRCQILELVYALRWVVSLDEVKESSLLRFWSLYLCALVLLLRFIDFPTRLALYFAEQALATRLFMHLDVLVSKRLGAAFLLVFAIDLELVQHLLDVSLHTRHYWLFLEATRAVVLHQERLHNAVFTECLLARVALPWFFQQIAAELALHIIQKNLNFLQVWNSFKIVLGLIFVRSAHSIFELIAHMFRNFFWK